MQQLKPTPEILEIPVKRIIGPNENESIDMLSVEEPLEIRIKCGTGSNKQARAMAVTMRTPGDDSDLALGFLFTEGVISGYDQVRAVKKAGCNVVQVTLQDGVEIDPTLFERHSYVASSCGVCGKRSIEAVQTRRNYRLRQPFRMIDSEVIYHLPETLRKAQKSFDTTGGIHASGLFDLDGNLLMIKEDVGRHNALDKLLGACMRSGKLPLEDRVILVSGRASFELVQKAAHAGTSILAAVGAPSSLAVQLANDSGMTLLGFVRANRFNIYTGLTEPAPAGEVICST